MAPNPTAEPALAKINPKRVPQTERSEEVAIALFLVSSMRWQVSVSRQLKMSHQAFLNNQLAILGQRAKENLVQKAIFTKKPKKLICFFGF